MTVRFHHLNCATMCPPGGRLVDGKGGLFHRGKLVCHCLLIETGEGLTLVDTGIGKGDLENPGRLPLHVRSLVAPRLDPAETALAQIEALGHRAADVRHIVLTHLDFDHAGGLADFPQAQVHVFAAEREAAFASSALIERHRYFPIHWAHGPKWVTHEVEGEPWFGFDAVRALPAGADDLLLVPLHGHTRGHCGVGLRYGSKGAVCESAEVAGAGEGRGRAGPGFLRARSGGVRKVAEELSWIDRHQSL